jgi:hypothetical protein
MKLEPLEPLNLEDVEGMLADLNWSHKNFGGFIHSRPPDVNFHASFWLQKFNQIDWLVGASYPVVRVPDSRELREFINRQNLRRGNILMIYVEQSGFVNLRIVASYPAANLSSKELNFLFLGLFLDGKQIGEEILGRFGGEWKVDE